MGNQAKSSQSQKRLAKQNGATDLPPVNTNVKDFPSAIRQQLVTLEVQISELKSKMEFLRQQQIAIAGEWLKQAGHDSSLNITIDITAGTFTLPKKPIKDGVEEVEDAEGSGEG